MLISKPPSVTLRYVERIKDLPDGVIPAEISQHEKNMRDSPGGTVVKNLPDNAGDMG